MGGDGKAVYAIIDGGTFGEIWTFPADGRGEGKALTQGAQDYIWRLFPAPKGNTLLYTTKRGKLMELDTATGKSTEIDRSMTDGDPPWSTNRPTSDVPTRPGGSPDPADPATNVPLPTRRSTTPSATRRS